MRWMGTFARVCRSHPPNTNAVFSLSIGIRRSAFEKLAALAVKSPARDDGSELARLAEQSRSARPSDGALNGALKDQAPASRVPMVRSRLASRLKNGRKLTDIDRESVNSMSFSPCVKQPRPSPNWPTRLNWPHSCPDTCPSHPPSCFVPPHSSRVSRHHRGRLFHMI